MSTKDIKAKEYLRDNERFADLFNYYLFDGKQVIFPEDLSERDSAEKISIQEDVLQERFRDLLKFSVIKQNDAAMFVLLGLETQDKVHYAMPVRTLLYDAIQYASQIKRITASHKASDYSDSAEFLSGFRKSDRIMPVITLVLYLGASVWDGPRSLYDMMDFPEPSLKRFINDYPLHLIVPAEIENFDKFRTEVGALLEIIKASNSKKLLNNLLYSKEKFQKLNRETIQIINESIGTKICVSKNEGGIDMLCNAIKEMMDDAKTEGCAEYSNAVRLIRQGTDTLDGLTAKGISEETAKMALEAMLEPV